MLFSLWLRSFCCRNNFETHLVCSFTIFLTSGAWSWHSLLDKNPPGESGKLSLPFDTWDASRDFEDFLDRLERCYLDFAGLWTV